MDLEYLEGVTHNHVRHGTITLFAAFNLAAGTVTGGYRQRIYDPRREQK